MTTHTPLRCAFSGMAAPDANGNSVLMDTGNYPSYSSFLNETWTFNGTDWTNTSATLIDANGPLPARTQMTFVYDGYHVMLFGGEGAASGQVFNDTWTWNGTTWTQRAPATVPFGRYGAQAGFISGVGTFMFGGAGGSGSGVLLNETWKWNGSGLTWTQSTPTTSPSARMGHVMAAGPSYILMFGGVVSSGEFQNDTWKFDGTNWTKLAPATSPSVRGFASMAYDSAHGQWVLFGGVNEYNFLPETWTFDGTTWTLHAPATTPSGRKGAQICFDSHLNSGAGQVLMFGGINATDNYPSNTIWTWNGTTWAKL